MIMTDNEMISLAKQYVDEHKDEPGWIDKMIAYYTTTCYVLVKDADGNFVPICETRSRIDNYTQHVLDYLRSIK